MSELWAWIGTLPSPQASVVGTAFAAVLGFGTLSAGHVLNFHLARRRDRYLFRVEQLNLLRALTNEVGQVASLLRNQISILQTTNQFKEPMTSVINPMTIATVYPANLSKLHLLPPEATNNLIGFHAGLAEHEYNVGAHGITPVGSAADPLKIFHFSTSHASAMVKLDKELLQKAELTVSACLPLVRKLVKHLGKGH